MPAHSDVLLPSLVCRHPPRSHSATLSRGSALGSAPEATAAVEGEAASRISTYSLCRMTAMWYTLSRMRRCRMCHEPIAAARVAALPATTTCVACSTEQPVKGYMTWEHKTAPVFQVVTPAQHQWLQSRDRKGMRSGLPLSSRGSSAPLLPVAYTSSSATPVEVAATQSMVPFATKCRHTDRPQASSAGKCLECAMAYYEVRIAANKYSAVKKGLRTP